MARSTSQFQTIRSEGALLPPDVLRAIASQKVEGTNRREESLWGFFSNGLVLRILRDNVSLSRQAYVEFDLEAMMEGEVYADFALLWMLCHQSRVEGDKPQDFWLEKWSQLAREQGTRVLSDLRTGVAKAIEALGRGLPRPSAQRLAPPAASGRPTRQAGVLPPGPADRLSAALPVRGRGPRAAARPRRRPSRLRTCTTPTTPLAAFGNWPTRSVAPSMPTFGTRCRWSSMPLGRPARLSASRACPPSGPSSGAGQARARFWGPAHKGAEPVEHPVFIANDDLLAAVRALAFVEQDKARRSVDYRNLGSEELGSVYESLLELHPAMNIPGRTFELDIAAGHERKTTGSYYTPDSLVQCLLDSALEPVVAERIKGKKADGGGQGHSGPQGLRPGLRQWAFSHCRCPPACQAPGPCPLRRDRAKPRRLPARPARRDRPLHLRRGHQSDGGRIVQGQSLDGSPGAGQAAIVPRPPHPMRQQPSGRDASTSLRQGVPDEAFKAIEGDDGKACQELKADNKRERKDYQRGYRDFHVPYPLGNQCSRRLAIAVDRSVLEPDGTADVCKAASCASTGDSDAARPSWPTCYKPTRH